MFSLMSKSRGWQSKSGKFSQDSRTHNISLLITHWTWPLCWTTRCTFRCPPLKDLFSQLLVSCEHTVVNPWGVTSAAKKFLTQGLMPSQHYSQPVIDQYMNVKVWPLYPSIGLLWRASLAQRSHKISGGYCGTSISVQHFPLSNPVSFS